MASEPAFAAPAVAVSISRDRERARASLSDWLASRLPDADTVQVTSLSAPHASGGSSETYFIDVEIGRGAATETRAWVIRIDPTEFRLFLRRNFDAQHRLLTHLAAHSDIPLPPILFYEPDAAVLGAPFWIMSRVDGQVPPDNPWYNSGGFLFDATEDERRRLWRSGVETLAKVARLDPATLPPVVALAPGQSGMDENLRHWTRSMDWACDGQPGALLADACEWLWANRPPREETGLSWGDARIGNMIFRDWRCVAVLDWETITLAGPQLDLAHWLVMDVFASDTVGATRLPGLGGRAETIALWEELTGLVADRLEWHEMLALFRLTVIMERSARLWAATGRTDLRDANGDTITGRQLRRMWRRISGR